MTTKQTPFMMPFQFHLDQRNSFEIRDAEGHFICRVITAETVVENEKLAGLLTEAPAMRELLERILNSADATGCSEDLTVVSAEALDTAGALLARIAGRQA